MITAANIGDSRLLVVSRCGKVLLATKDHKPNDSVEKARIEKAGHIVEECSVLSEGKRFKVWRVDGEYSIVFIFIVFLLNYSFYFYFYFLFYLSLVCA